MEGSECGDLPSRSFKSPPGALRIAVQTRPSRRYDPDYHPSHRAVQIDRRSILIDVAQEVKAEDNLSR